MFSQPFDLCESLCVMWHVYLKVLYACPDVELNVAEVFHGLVLKPVEKWALPSVR